MRVSVYSGKRRDSCCLPQTAVFPEDICQCQVHISWQEAAPGTMLSLLEAGDGRVIGLNLGAKGTWVVVAIPNYSRLSWQSILSLGLEFPICRWGTKTLLLGRL